MLIRTFNRSFLSLLIIGCFVSCTELQINYADFQKQQELLTHIIENRRQLIGVEYFNSVLTIHIKNALIGINTATIPYLSVNNEGFWSVNGNNTSIHVKTDSTYNPAFPELVITEDTYLLIDGCLSDYKRDQNNNHALNTADTMIWAIARIDNTICFYINDNSTVIVPITEKEEHIIPDYFWDIVVDKEKKAEEWTKFLPTDEVMSYVFFTDAHWGNNQKHSPAIIKHIVDYTNIQYVLFGGDANTNRTETVQGTLDIGYQFHNAFEFLGSKFYCLFGNHDDNTSGQSSATDRHLTEEQVYSYLQSQMTNVHYWDYYNYYFDDPDSKTRFICMDTGRFYEKSLRGATYKTAQFAIECLSAVPDGWHIVAASHIWANLKSFDTGEMIESEYVRPIIEILENYNRRVKASFSYEGKSIEYDFSNAGAIIEYCIGGHTHSDGIVSSKQGLPLIIVTCDGQQQVAGGAPFKTGTVDEQCVTIIVNDYKDRKVHIFHIGRGEDVTVDMWSLT